MEALAALSLAGNILQFLDFGQKLISRATEISGSATGNLAVHAELRTISGDLSTICERLDVSQDDSSSAEYVTARRKLLPISTMCRALAFEFEEVLQKLQRQSQNSKLMSLRQALKSLWNERLVKEYARRLESCRSQLMVRLLDFLSSQIKSISSHLTDIAAAEQRHYTVSAEIRKELSDLRHDVKRFSQKHLDEDGSHSSGRCMSDTTSSFESCSKDLAHLRQSLEMHFDRAHEALDEESLIRSLEFPEIDDRRSRVVDASSGTFDWIFEQSSFKEWMTGSHEMYWVTGKPGSGKSTLMKYLLNHPRMNQSLQAWAQGSELIVASFFFWNYGTTMQKSQQGLLQGLLHRILCQCPHLLPIVCPNRWNEQKRVSKRWDHGTGRDLYALTRSWSFNELVDSFKNLKKASESMKSHFCFLIDGLDEYEGDHAELIATVRNLASARIKICFSSRPWNVFEETFGTDSAYSIRIHEHTQSDIVRYVKEQLEEDARFARLRDADPSYGDLVGEISNRANGVFLWVFLVVRSFRRGLTNADTITDFQRRLSTIPTDLKTYFKQMLGSVEEIYRREAARIYTICLYTIKPLYLHTLAYFGETNPSFGVDLPSGSSDELPAHCAMWVAKTRVLARCSDLLEIYVDALGHEEVDFLHRTAADFLASEEIWKILDDLEPGFDVNNFQCQASLALLKSSVDRSYDSPLKDICIHQFVVHAKSMELRSHESSNTLMESILDFANSEMQRDSFNAKRFFRNLFGYAAKVDLYTFLSANSDELKLAIQLDKENFPYESILRPALGSQSSSGVIRLLLELGASPNKKLGPCSGTVWQRWTENLRDYPVSFTHQMQEVARIAELMLLHGAKIEIHSDKVAELREAFSSNCLPEDTERLFALIEQRIESMKQVVVEAQGGQVDQISREHIAQDVKGSLDTGKSKRKPDPCSVTVPATKRRAF